MARCGSARIPANTFRKFPEAAADLVPSLIRSGDDEPFEEKMMRLVAQLREQQARAARLDATLFKNPEELGFGKGT